MLQHRRPRVVLIDDDVTVTRAIARNLKNIRSYDVIAFNDPQAAFGYLLADWDVNVVITDVQMPRWTGVDIHAHVLEEIPEMADRFIYITGECKNHPFFVSRGRKLIKPFKTEEMISLIEEVVAMPPKDLFVSSESYQPLRRIV